MQISLRSHLIAGTAAIVGAGAIAMTPVVAAHANVPALKVPSAVQVALTGFDSPISELLTTVQYLNDDLFDGVDYYDEYSWQPYYGIVPEFIYTALPVISQLGYNGSAYIGNTIGAVTDSAYQLSEAVWNFPGAVVTATKQVIAGDVAGAITTLTNATLVPLQSAVTTSIGAITSVVTGVVTSITNLVAAVPSIVQRLVTTTVGSVQALVNAVIQIGTQSLGALSGGNFEGAWNVVVDGLFGPTGADGLQTSSIPGVLEATTIGPGLGSLGAGNGFAVPSFRMWAEQSQLQVANALGATYPVPAASVKPAAATAARVAAPVAAVTAGSARAAAADNSAPAESAPAESTPASDAPAASTDNSSAAPKAAKHGVSRKAAKAAADS